MHDAIEFEKRGIPAVPVLTAPFLSEARRKAAYMSYPNLQLAVVDHPFSALTRDEIRARAAQALPQIVRALFGQAQQGG